MNYLLLSHQTSQISLCCVCSHKSEMVRFWVVSRWSTYTIITQDGTPYLLGINQWFCWQPPTQLVKNPLAKQETTCSAWNPGSIPGSLMGYGEELWQNMVHWRRKWQPTQVFLLGKSHGQRSCGLQFMGRGVTKSWTQLND